VSVLEDHPEVELWLGGHLEPTDATVGRLGERCRRISFLPWHRLPETLRDLDVNLAPLQPGSRFNDAKSAIKWLEAALVATPTIASPSAPFRDAIDDGTTGWLADDPDEWAACLDRVLRDGDLRDLVAARARRAALLRWSPHRQGDRYLDILGQVLAQPSGRQPSPAWTPVALDEPTLPVRTPLEPYPVPLRGSIGWRVRRIPRPNVVRRLRIKLGAIRRSVREDGVGATVQRATRALLRRPGD
jgi:hypothetical protein